LQHKPSPNATVMLVSVNARISKATTTDANGQFKFDNLIFPDSAKFAVQARGVKNSSNLIISLDNIPAVAINKKQNTADINIVKADLQKAEQEGVVPKLTGHVLRQVNIKDIRNKADKSVIPQGMFSLPDEESADHIYTIPDPEHYIDLKMFLQERVAGILVNENGLQDVRPPHNSIGIIVNGVNGTFAGIESIDLAEIAKIEMVRTNYAMTNYLRQGNSEKIGGFLLILTKPQSARKHYDPNITNISPKGYNSVRQFYSPRYDYPNDATKPDLRTTIYWNPYVNTDTNGKATLDFFNADGPGIYRVVIEGINAAGELGRQVYNYKVE